MEELRQFSEDLVEKPMILVASKIDAAPDETGQQTLATLAEELKLPFLAISAVTGENIEKLRHLIGTLLPPGPVEEPIRYPELPVSNLVVATSELRDEAPELGPAEE